MAITLVAVLLAVGTSIGAGYWAYVNLLYPQTGRGNCFVLAPKNCISLSRDYVERELIGSPLPEVVTIETSGSRATLKSREEWALLRSVNISDFDRLPGSVAESGATPSVPPTELLDKGFTEVTRKLLLSDDSGNYTLSYTGIDKRGQTLAYVLRFHDL
ncbi:hypothetical protein GX865_05830 [Candidatus Saccharibacteria bacterium]|nr:hypothetical protein [Candidatus Saccharibacteria bacterium]